MFGISRVGVKKLRKTGRGRSSHFEEELFCEARKGAESQ